jgi:choline dehydrogenase-like flavoprotein
MSEFDYVIVGGGVAGCVVANRLTEDPSVRVAMLEFGTDKNHKKQIVRAPLGMVTFMMPNLAFLGGTKMMYLYEAEPSRGLGNQKMMLPRGKALGGSSMVNGMIYIRGQKQDFDDWRDMGNPGWGYDDLLPYFRKSENFVLASEPDATKNFELGGRPVRDQIDMAYHGIGGPVSVAPPRSPNPLCPTYFEAAKQAGYKLNADFNGEDQEGIGYHWLTQKGGERWGAESSYANPARERPNLTIITEARALEILMDGKRATGVKYDRAGEISEIKAGKEVILATGAFISPQLLQLSGIGDPKELKRHGIEVRHALPGVGQNLQDHIDTWTKQRTKTNLTYGISWGTMHSNAMHILKWFAGRRGMLTSNTGEAGGFIKSGPEVDRPDLQLFFCSTMASAQASDSFWGHGWAMHACLLRPKSVGHVGLKSDSPYEAPLIAPNFLGDPYDMEILIRGVKIMREITRQPAFDPHRGEEVAPGPSVQTDDDIAAYIRSHSMTMYHPTSTCKMGTDDMAVVAPDSLLVHGLENLAIVDASVMPAVISGNTFAPTVAVAEKAADLIKARGKARTARAAA